MLGVLEHRALLLHFVLPVAIVAIVAGFVVNSIVCILNISFLQSTLKQNKKQHKMFHCN